MNLELLKTADGSFSLYRSDMDETYHSRHGALQEALHVFIEAGLNHQLHKHPRKDVLNVFELGWGTGLNFFLSLEHFPSTKSLFYFGLEKHPLALDLHQQWLNEMQWPQYKSWIEKPWNSLQTENNITLYKAEQDVFEFLNPGHLFDLIYYDAFGFRAQEEMWSIPVCRYLFDICASNGVLVTYAAKGLIRRNLEKVGFICERLPGPPGKREMLRATKA